MLLACDDCWQLRPHVGAPWLGWGVIVVGLVLGVLGLFLLLRARSAMGRRRLAYVGLAAAVLVAGTAVLPQINEVYRVIPGRQPRVLCGKPALEGRNEALDQVEAIGMAPAAVAACRDGFAERRALSYSLLGGAAVLATAPLVFGGRRRGGSTPASVDDPEDAVALA